MRLKHLEEEGAIQFIRSKQVRFSKPQEADVRNEDEPAESSDDNEKAAAAEEQADEPDDHQHAKLLTAKQAASALGTFD